MLNGFVELDVCKILYIYIKFTTLLPFSPSTYLCLCIAISCNRVMQEAWHFLLFNVWDYPYSSIVQTLIQLGEHLFMCIVPLTSAEILYLDKCSSRWVKGCTIRLLPFNLTGAWSLPPLAFALEHIHLVLHQELSRSEVKSWPHWSHWQWGL